MPSIDILLQEAARDPHTDRWRMHDKTHNYGDLPLEAKEFLMRRAFKPAGYPLDLPVLKLDTPFELTHEQEEAFRYAHVISLHSQLVLPGESMPLIQNDDTHPPLLNWHVWNDQLCKVDIHGLQYATGQFVEGYSVIAYRDDPEIQMGSRSLSFISRFLVKHPEMREYYGLPEDVEHVTVVYPGLGGLGYALGASRRHGVNHYSNSTMKNIAIEATKECYLLDKEASIPEEKEVIIMAASMPGWINPTGAAHQAFAGCYGFTGVNVGSIDNQIRWYGRVVSDGGQEPFNPRLMRILHPLRAVRQSIMAIPTSAVFHETPPPELI